MPDGYRRASAGDIADCIRLRAMTRENAISAARLAELGITEASWGAEVAAERQFGMLYEAAGPTASRASHGASPVSGAIAGYCFGDVRTGEIIVLALLPQCEGQGIGRRLLRLVVDQLAWHGHSRLFLGCSTDPRVRSHGFYRHLGWRSTGALDAHGDEVLELVLTGPAD